MEKYSGKNYDRAKFQKDLGLQLINYAVEQEWANCDGPRPSWIWQTPSFLSCDCKKCFFCLNKYCNGIYHNQDPTINVYEVDRKKRKVIGHTDEPVNCFQGVSQYCKMFYRNATGKVLLRRNRNANTPNLDVLIAESPYVENSGIMGEQNNKNQLIPP